MKYIIYGSGATGKIAFRYLGDERVAFFATSRPYSNGLLYERKILAYQDMISLPDNEYIIVVASELYFREMVERLIADNIHNYFVFHEADITAMEASAPTYKVYFPKLLNQSKIENYHSIAIHGFNKILPYLIAEVKIRCGASAVKAICDDILVSEDIEHAYATCF